jgi:hypothetical protein
MQLKIAPLLTFCGYTLRGLPSRFPSALDSDLAERGDGRGFKGL